MSEKYFPAKHGEQNEAPGCENCPEAHVMQSARESWSVGELVWSKARYVSRTHGKHFALRAVDEF